MPEQVVKLRKKQWYPIIAPKQFNNVVLGETLVYEPQAMIGKTLSHSLMNLANDVKRQSISIHFKVVDVDNGRAKTMITGYEIIPYSVKRFVRRNSEKMDISFTCETADNVLMRIKPLIITKADIKGSIAAKLRNNAVNFLVKAIKKMTYDELINDLISHKLQESLRESLSRVYPLKVCEIRYAGIEARERREDNAEAEAKAKAETKEKE